MIAKSYQVPMLSFLNRAICLLNGMAEVHTDGKSGPTELMHSCVNCWLF